MDLFKPNIKAIAWGTALFLILLTLGSGFLSLLHVDLKNSMIYWAYVGILAVPGFVAARIAGRNGIVNGALVGVTAIVLIAVVLQIFFSNPPPNAESISGIQVGLQMGLTAVIMCSIGGLIWELWHRSRRNRSKPE